MCGGKGASVREDGTYIYWVARLEAESMVNFEGFASPGCSRSNVLERWTLQAIKAFYDGVASRFVLRFRSRNFLLPGLVSKCGATDETSWPPAVMVFLILFR